MAYGEQSIARRPLEVILTHGEDKPVYQQREPFCFVKNAVSSPGSLAFLLKKALQHLGRLHRKQPFLYANAMVQ